MLRSWSPLLSIALAVVVGAAPVLAAVAVSTVSGPSPYAACANQGETGTVYINDEVEPYVAVNPTTVGSSNVNIIGVWQQDRWSNGGAHGLVAGFSLDGGTTWGETALPFSSCTPGAVDDPFTGAPYFRASDPWVSIGPDGTAYTVALMATASGPGLNDTGIATAVSHNGGKTWGTTRLLKADQGTSPVFELTHFFNDKESITADPTRAGTAYVVWDRLQAPSHSPDSALNARAFRGPTWFSMTTDGGQTWTTARPIFDPGQNSQTIGNIIVVDPTSGRLYDFYSDFQTTGSPNFIPRGISVGFVSSDDGGLTWSGPTTVSSENVADDVDPNTNAPLRTEEEVPSVAIDPRVGGGGRLYVVWEDATSTGGAFNQVVISTSSDKGRTWSAPAVVNTPEGRLAFTPTVAVSSDGTVGVTYYDLRNLAPTNKTTLPTDLWMKTSPEGATSFSADTHIDGSFDLLAAPFAGGFFLGDYEGIGVNGKSFVPFFVKTNCAAAPCAGTNPTDVFAARP
jgi:lipid-binding SYLF domain-containing protein